MDRFGGQDESTVQTQIQQLVHVMYSVLDGIALLGALHAFDVLGKCAHHLHVRAGGQNGQMGDVGDGAHANQTDTILFFHMLKLTFVAAAQDLAKKPPSTAIVNPFT